MPYLDIAGKAMTDRNDSLTERDSSDGIDRRGFLKCMAWAGTGLLWTITGGIPASAVLGQPTMPGKNDFTFLQISDSHIGFSQAANPNVTATLEEAVSRINA